MQVRGKSLTCRHSRKFISQVFDLAMMTIRLPFIYLASVLTSVLIFLLGDAFDDELICASILFTSSSFRHLA
jgi:hypothetical protein